METLTAQELNFQRAILAVQRRLMQHGMLTRSTVRLSCALLSDADFQRLLDAIVAGGIATRYRGKRGGEVYRSTIQLKEGENKNVF
jgi:hypothetical protein